MTSCGLLPPLVTLSSARRDRSKSTCLYALYRHALVTNAWDVAMGITPAEGAPVFGIHTLHPVMLYEAKELMDRIQQWKIGEADAPMVTATKIARLKDRPRHHYSPVP